MNPAESAGPSAPPSFADRTLKAASIFWFLAALAGQWLFAYYILRFYGGHALDGDWAAWTDRMIVGFIEGDLIGNAAVILHIALAFYVTFFGPLQLFPLIRQRAPAFHHWNGRLYGATAFIISLGALYMVWTRGAFDGAIGGPNAIGISINAVLIMIFAGLAIRYAVARRIDLHHPWALRLFLSMSAVWFMRVGYGIWFFIHQGGRAPGVTAKLDGWFDITLPFVAALFPLFVFDLYLRAKRSGSPALKLAIAALIVLLTLMMACGIVTFASMRWLNY